MNALVKLSRTHTVTVLVAPTLNGTVHSHVAKVTAAHVGQNAPAILTALSAYWLTQAPTTSHRPAHISHHNVTQTGSHESPQRHTDWLTQAPTTSYSYNSPQRHTDWFTRFTTSHRPTHITHHSVTQTGSYKPPQRHIDQLI